MNPNTIPTPQQYAAAYAHVHPGVAMTTAPSISDLYDRATADLANEDEYLLGWTWEQKGGDVFSYTQTHRVLGQVIRGIVKIHRHSGESFAHAHVLNASFTWTRLAEEPTHTWWKTLAKDTKLEIEEPPKDALVLAKRLMSEAAVVAWFATHPEI